MEPITQTELRRVGHLTLTTILHEVQDGIVPLSPDYARCAELYIKTGLLATLLRIADDISKLVGMYNATTMLDDKLRR